MKNIDTCTCENLVLSISRDKNTEKSIKLMPVTITIQHHTDMSYYFVKAICHLYAIFVFSCFHNVIHVMSLLKSFFSLLNILFK